MSTLKFVRAMFTFVSLALASGCYGSTVRVIKTSPTARLQGFSTVYVAPLAMDRVRVEGSPEPLYMNAKREDGRGQYWLERSMLIEEFQQRLAKRLTDRGLTVIAAPTAGALIIQPSLMTLTPGFWAFVEKDAEATILVDVRDSDDLLERFAIQDKVKTALHLGTADGRERMRRLAEGLSGRLNKYLGGRLVASR
jgi:hypothetical protein